MICFLCHSEQNRSSMRTITIVGRNHIFSPEGLPSDVVFYKPGVLIMDVPSGCKIWECRVITLNIVPTFGRN